MYLQKVSHTLLYLAENDLSLINSVRFATFDNFYFSRPFLQLETAKRPPLCKRKKIMLELEIRVVKKIPGKQRLEVRKKSEDLCSSQHLTTTHAILAKHQRRLQQHQSNDVTIFDNNNCYTYKQSSSLAQASVVYVRTCSSRVACKKSTQIPRLSLRRRSRCQVFLTPSRSKTRAGLILLNSCCLSEYNAMPTNLC